MIAIVRFAFLYEVRITNGLVMHYLNMFRNSLWSQVLRSGSTRQTSFSALYGSMSENESQPSATARLLDETVRRNGSERLDSKIPFGKTVRRYIVPRDRLERPFGDTVRKRLFARLFARALESVWKRKCNSVSVRIC